LWEPPFYNDRDKSWRDPSAKTDRWQPAPAISDAEARRILEEIRGSLPDRVRLVDLASVYAYERPNEHYRYEMQVGLVRLPNWGGCATFLKTFDHVERLGDLIAVQVELTFGDGTVTALRAVHCDDVTGEAPSEWNVWF